MFFEFWSFLSLSKPDEPLFVPWAPPAAAAKSANLISSTYGNQKLSTESTKTIQYIESFGSLRIQAGLFSQLEHQVCLITIISVRSTYVFVTH